MKKARVAILILDKVSFRIRNINRNKKEYFNNDQENNLSRTQITLNVYTKITELYLYINKWDLPGWIGRQLLLRFYFSPNHFIHLAQFWSEF